MAAAVTDRGRAETYLRLLAETELRRALAAPPLPAPGARPSATVRSLGIILVAADRIGRPLRPALVRAADAVTPLARRTVAVLEPPARDLRRRVRRTRNLPGLSQAIDGAVRWRGGPRPTGREAADAVYRVCEAADVLVAVRALSPAVADEVTGGLELAVALRRRLTESPAEAVRFAGPGHSRVPPSAADGPVTAAGIGATVSLGRDGHRALMVLVSLVIGPDQALLPVLTWPVRAGDDPWWDGLQDEGHGGMFTIMNGLTGRATDDRGGTYRITENSGGGSYDGPWEGELTIRPVPPPEISHLDLSFPGEPDIRVSLPPGPDSAGRESGLPDALPPGSRAERLVDMTTQHLLHWAGQGHPDPLGRTGVLPVVSTLRGAGLLAADSPALARLATVIRRARARPGDDLAAAGLADQPAAQLPPAWRSALGQAQYGARPRGEEPDAPDAVVCTAAVLPPLEGIRCAVTGVRSAAGRVTVQALCWGWSALDDPAEAAGTESCWLARDSTGQWMTGETESGSGDDEHAEIQLTLSPPPDPAATTLDLILVGGTGQVAVTIPLTWRPVP
jgi:hypothetical protein